MKYICSVLVLWFSFNLLTYGQVANFTASDTAGCQGLTVTFINTSVGNSNTYSWNFGNGNSAPPTTQNTQQVANYTNPGTYTVTLTATSGANSSTKTATITVYKNPTAAFTAADTTGCIPLTAQFEDASIEGSASINSWLWDFGDASPAATSYSTSHQYTSAGNFTVTLLVTDKNGCFSTMARQNTIIVSSTTVSAGFTPTDTTICSAPGLVQFQDTSKGSTALTYAWSFGDGAVSNQTSPVHNYLSLGVYPVKLIVTNTAGCTSTKTGTVAIVGPPNTNFSVTPADSICQGNNLSFNNLSFPSPTAVHWDFGDSTSSTNSSPNHNYLHAGIYTVKLLTTFGGLCVDSVVRTNLISINPLPIPLFKADSLIDCQLPFTVHFTDSTVNAARWLWNFGDGASDTVQKPQHTYQSAGTQNVSLTITSNKGCSITQNLPVPVKITLPQAKISVQPIIGCTPMTVNFSDTNSTSVQKIVTYKWNFNDSASLSLDTITYRAQGNTTHIYNSGKFYYPKLTITNAYGCQSIDSVLVKVYNHPVMKFAASTPAPDSACALSPITFTDSSLYVDTWSWNFGDSTANGSGIQTTHYYKKLGLFNIKLYVSNPGCTDSLIKPSYIHIKPSLPLFTSTSTCINLYQRTYNNNTLGNVAALKYYWNFGDTSSIDSTVYNPIHKFKYVGIYKVTLTILDTITGCKNDTVLTEHVIKLDSSFSILHNQGCPGLVANFVPKSAIDPTVNYNWTFGDGSTTTTPSPAHTFVNPGLYSVKLVVKDQIGCADSLTKTDSVKVYRLYAGFELAHQTGCDSLLVQLKDTSVAAPPITKWKWNYGDGTIDSTTLGSDQHYFKKIGTYQMQLTTTNADGTCTSNPIPVTYILPIAQSTYTANYHCPGVTYTFSNSSQNADQYLWKFGDGSTNSNQVAPVHNYSKDSIYKVVFIATSSQTGCKDSLIDSLHVLIDYPKAYFYNPSPNARCTPYLATFNDTSRSRTAITNRYWIFGDNGTNGVNLNPSDTVVNHTYLKVGSYSLKLVITNMDGCQDSVSKPNFFSLAGPYGSFTEFATKGCAPHSVNFTYNVADAKSFMMVYGDGSSDTFADTVTYGSHLYKANLAQYETNYQPSLVMLDSTGCKVYLSNPDTIKVVTTPVAKFTYSPQYPEMGKTVDFKSNSGPATDWIWNFGDHSLDSSSVVEDPTHLYANAGRFTIKYSVINNYLGISCKDSTLENITVVEPLNPPNVFTPNADGIDDQFIINSPGIINITAHIYNRWGLEVFYKQADIIVWDGYDSAGLQVPEGTYYYVVTGYSLQTQTTVTKKGFLELIR